MTDGEPKYVTGHDIRLWRESDPEVRKLLEMKAKYEDELFSIQGVTGVGVGLGKERGVSTNDLVIRVYVDKDLLTDQLEATKNSIPSMLEGCHVQVLESGPVKDLQGSDPEAVYRPLQGGVEVAATTGTGTLTAISRGPHQGRLQTYLVRALHTATSDKFTPSFGEPIYQPADLKLVAQLSRGLPVFQCPSRIGPSPVSSRTSRHRGPCRY